MTHDLIQVYSTFTGATNGVAVGFAAGVEVTFVGVGVVFDIVVLVVVALGLGTDVVTAGLGFTAVTVVAGTALTSY